MCLEMPRVQWPEVELEPKVIMSLPPSPSSSVWFGERKKSSSSISPTGQVAAKPKTSWNRLPVRDDGGQIVSQVRPGTNRISVAARKPTSLPMGCYSDWTSSQQMAIGEGIRKAENSTSPNTQPGPRKSCSAASFVKLEFRCKLTMLFRGKMRRGNGHRTCKQSLGAWGSSVAGQPEAHHLQVRIFIRSAKSPRTIACWHGLPRPIWKSQYALAIDRFKIRWSARRHSASTSSYLPSTRCMCLCNRGQACPSQPVLYVWDFLCCNTGFIG